MITKITKDNQASYKTLFEDAGDILFGYKSVKVYDVSVDKYYKKVLTAESTAEDLFQEDTSITSLQTFAQALSKYKVYVKLSGTNDDGSSRYPVPGFDPLLGITTLEEYFSWMAYLGQINRKYTVLPLDEPHFTIDLNTRAIQIPNEFRKNGIAVQGDDLAEIVYFEVDRYFDYMDLNNTEIYIQWELPKTGYKSVSTAYTVDIESKPGKLIFGWPISDIITENAGTIKFSVRFFEWEDEVSAENAIANNSQGNMNLTYSLSTLTATATIHPSINFNIEKDKFKVDDCGDRLIGRLENSQIVGNYEAKTPIFYLNLEDREYDLDTNTNTYELAVAARSEDTGAITYSWRKDGETIGSTSRFIAIAPEDVDEDSGINYYIKAGDGYTLTTNIYDESGNIKDGLYTKQSICIANDVGDYWAIAENRLTNSSAMESSIHAIFPGPEVVEFTTDLADKGHTGDTLSISVKENSNNVISYQWYKATDYTADPDENTLVFEPIAEANTNIYTPSDSGRYKVEVTNTRNTATSESQSSIICRFTDPAIALVVDSEASSTFAVGDIIAVPYTNEMYEDADADVKIIKANLSDDVKYNWYYVKTNTGANGEVITENILLNDIPTNNSFNPIDYIDKIPQINGNYKCSITNIFNGTIATTDWDFDIDSAQS